MNNSVDEKEDDDDFYDNDHVIEKEESRGTQRSHADSQPMQSQRRNKARRVGRPEYNVPEDATPESMIEINDKLTGELEQLIVAVENQIDRVRKEKEQNLKQLQIREDPNEDVRKKENELKRAQVKIQSLKKSINSMKKQLDNAYDVEKTLVLENDLKYQQKIYEKLVSETTSLKKVEKEQNKAFTILNEDEDAERRLQAIKEEVHNTKQEAREKSDQLRKVGEEMKQQHSQTIEMEQKCRKITQALKQRNSRTAASDTDQSELLTDEQVQERIAEIEDLEYQKKQEEKKYEKLIRQVEAKITQVEHDKNIWAIKLKEKDQEYRLNELRIKELKRQVPQKALKPLPNKEQNKLSKKKQRPVDPRVNLKQNVKKSSPKLRTAKDVSVDIQKQHEEETKLEEDEPEQSNKLHKRESQEKQVSLAVDNRSDSPSVADQKPQVNAKVSQDDSDNEKRKLSEDGKDSKPKRGTSGMSENKDKDGGFYDNSFSEDNKPNRSDDSRDAEKDGKTFVTKR